MCLNDLAYQCPAMLIGHVCKSLRTPHRVTVHRRAMRLAFGVQCEPAEDRLAKRLPHMEAAADAFPFERAVEPVRDERADLPMRLTRLLLRPMRACSARRRIVYPIPDRLAHDIP